MVSRNTAVRTALEKLIRQQFETLSDPDKAMFLSGYQFGTSTMINVVMDLVDVTDGKKVLVSDLTDVLRLAATPNPFEEK